jgi:hypothetical protein
MAAADRWLVGLRLMQAFHRDDAEYVASVLRGPHATEAIAMILRWLEGQLAHACRRAEVDLDEWLQRTIARYAVDAALKGLRFDDQTENEKGTQP